MHKTGKLITRTALVVLVTGLIVSITLGHASAHLASIGDQLRLLVLALSVPALVVGLSISRANRPGAHRR